MIIFINIDRLTSFFVCSVYTVLYSQINIFEMYLLGCEKMDYEELRPLVLEALKQELETQIVTLLDATENIALTKGFYSEKTPWSYLGRAEHKMPKEDREKVREIVGNLVIEGILTWGVDELNPGPPFLKVTEYGKDCLAAGEILPHDPDGYLKYLNSEIPAIDETIIMYVTESLQTFLRGNLLASTVMLGGASEKAVLLLIEAFVDAISNPIERQKFEREIKRSGILRKFRKFREKLDSASGKLPKLISDDLDIQLDGVFNLIRNCRNDVGHPTGRKIDRRLAFANLQLLIPYCKRIYELIEWLNQNQI